MKLAFILVFALMALSSCSTNKKDNKQSNTLEFQEIAQFAINKRVEFVIDSLQLKVDELTFIDEPPGIISSVSVTTNKGTIDFFFERISIILDTLHTKEYYLSRVAGKVINEVHWKDVDGKKGSIKNVKIY